MEMADEGGFFAALLEGRTEPVKYRLHVVMRTRTRKRWRIPYSGRFSSLFKEEELKKSRLGSTIILMKSWGRHPAVIDGVHGVHFAVGLRERCGLALLEILTSGMGRRHQMCRLGDSGIYELLFRG